MRLLITTTIKSKIGEQHTLFRQQIEEFVNDVLAKTDRYYKLAKTCSKHANSTYELFFLLM